MADKYEITEAFIESLKRRGVQVDGILNWIAGFTVDGAKAFSNKPNGVSITIDDAKTETPSGRVATAVLLKVKEYLDADLPGGIELARCVTTEHADGSGDEGVTDHLVIVTSHVDVGKTLVALRLQNSTGYEDDDGDAVLWQQMAAGVSVKVLGIGTSLGGIGYYDAGALSGSTTPIAVGTNFSVGALGSGKSVVFAHLLESGSDGSNPKLSLTSADIGIGVFVGMSDEDPQREVYAGFAFVGDNCKTGTSGGGEGDI